MGFWRDWLHAGGTGGLNWHVHAHRSLSRWQKTSSQIEHFLLQSAPRASDLILIGASAGWMLPDAWLTRFARIDCYDIDPLAQWLFPRRHGRALRQAGVELRLHRRDALATLEAILEAHPQAVIWFDNVLGQHRYRIQDEVETERQLNALKQQLLGRTWGSVHDVFSGPGRQTWPADQAMPVDLAPAQAYDDSRMQTLLQQVGAQRTWFDHGTRGVFPDRTPVHMLAWPFRQGYWHWLQMGWCTSPPR